MTTYLIYSIPDEVRGLEYLNLLYKHVQDNPDKGDRFVLRKFSWKELFFAKKQKDIKRLVHIHWETNIYGSQYQIISIIRMLYRFPLLWLIKLLGIRIVWTMHNLEAHDYPHARIDLWGKNIMWRLADTVIIQEKKIALKEQSKRPNSHIVNIPQGNYVNVYGPLWNGDKTELRKKYNLGSGIILLALGSVRPYKDLPSVIEALESLQLKGVDLKLLIMGKVSKEYEEELRKKINGNQNIVFIPGFVPDDKVPEVLAMADYSIFYYSESSLSSAAMILSLSYGVPVVTRDIPASEMIQEGNNGFIFQTQLELQDILQKLPQTSIMDRNAIIGTVQDQSWPNVAKRLREVYIGLWTK